MAPRHNFRLVVLFAAGMLAHLFSRAQFIMYPDTLKQGKFAGGSSLVEMRDGNWMRAGFSNYERICAEFHRYGADGHPDSSFGNQSVIRCNIAEGIVHISLKWMREDAKGRWVMGVTEKESNNFYNAVYRFLPDGTSDQSFGANGKLRLSESARFSLMEDGAIQPDGKIVMAGSLWDEGLQIGSSFFLMRVLENGKPDPTFGIRGLKKHELSWYMTSADKMLLQPDGKILVTGWAFRQHVEGYHITRFLPSGNTDVSFGDEEGAVVEIVSDAFSLKSCFLQSGGRIFITGMASRDLDGRGIMYNLIFQSHSNNGKTERDYDPMVLFPFSEWIEYGNKNAVAAPLPDGSVLLAFLKQVSSDSLLFRIEKFLPDGRKDPLFHPFGTLSNSFTIRPELRQNSGDLIVVDFHQGSDLLLKSTWRDKTILIKW